MRALPVILLALAGCNPGIAPVNEVRNSAAPVRNTAAPAPQPPASGAADTANAAETAPSAEPEAVPGLAGMSPYRRREYERGYRDCMAGNFDRERQGESYRIGCMAAEDERARRR